jgi:mannosylglucosylglycerate synthase
LAKKIISILHYSGPPHVGGVESTIAHHAIQLNRLGYEVRIITGRGKRIHPDIQNIVISEMGSRHPEVLLVGKQLAMGMVTQDFHQLQAKIYSKLATALQGTRVAIAHNINTLHKNLALTAACYQLAKEGLPGIAWCHDFAWQDELYTPELHEGEPWRLLKRIWPNTRYVAVSKHRRGRLASLLDLPHDQVMAITPGVDPYTFMNISPKIQEIIEKYQLLAAKPLMILPARITRRKNIELAIRITGALRHSHPHCQLIITGPPGPHNPKNIAYLNELKNLQTELGVKDHVIFLYEANQSKQPFHLSDRMIADLYRVADLLLFPSRKEGFGIPVLEAGLARLPVFAVDIPTVHESAGQYAHIFFVNDAPDEIAKNIEHILVEDSAYQLRKRTLDQFTWESIVKRSIVPLLEEY